MGKKDNRGGKPEGALSTVDTLGGVGNAGIGTPGEGASVLPTQDAFRPEHLDQDEASGPNYELQSLYKARTLKEQSLRLSNPTCEKPPNGKAPA